MKEVLEYLVENKDKPEELDKLIGNRKLENEFKKRAEEEDEYPDEFQIDTNVIRVPQNVHCSNLTKKRAELQQCPLLGFVNDDSDPTSTGARESLDNSVEKSPVEQHLKGNLVSQTDECE